MLHINETFYSLQGEGARAGESTLFVRLSGCDLACGFCDTEFASGAEMSVEQIVEIAKKAGTQWITWTGGEPMLQLTEDAVTEVARAGLRQSIETNGGHSIPFALDWVVVSPKVAEHVVAKNFANGVDELRYAWHAGKRSVPQPGTTARHYFLSPIFDGASASSANLKHCIKLCLTNPQWKLSVQLHKLWNIL
jgi:7-carboxy-7-deazaguanine synthase